MPAPGYILTLLLSVCFTLAAWLQPIAVNWNKSRAQSGGMLAIAMGDARRMFANHFFTKADVYFHSGYYPSIFDQGRTAEMHIAEQAGTDTREEHDQADANHASLARASDEPVHVHDEHCQHDEHEHDYLKPPRDWIESFGRNFFNTEHTELNGEPVREILPWLRIAAELDPQKVDTYTVGSFWLRKMKRPRDAEEFLREGLRANPDSFEILYEMGRLYAENYKDAARTRNLWLQAAHKLDAHQPAPGEDVLLPRRQILASLARLEEVEGNLGAAAEYLRRVQSVLAGGDPERGVIQTQIDELLRKMAAGNPK